MDDPLQLDALGQAAAIRAGELSPAELVDASLRKIAELNPRLNAVVVELGDLAAEAAKAVDLSAPLAGVPFLTKDLLVSVKGVPQTEGSRYLRGYVASVDSELVERYRRAGLLIVGTTNTPEFGNEGTTEGAFHRPAHNPWDVSRTPGGSSGGAGAAVAAGFVAAAHGSDGGGSIRNPASCCGLVGLKPTRGRNPFGPHFGEVWGGLVVEHVLTRSVRDCAALLDATCAPELGAPYEAPGPSETFLEAVTTSPGPLRIGVTRTRPQGDPFSEEADAAVGRAAALCEGLGHEVVEVNLTIDDGFDAAFVDLWAASNAWFVAYWTSIVGRVPKPDELEPLTWGLLERGRRQSAADHLLNLQYLARVSRDFCTLWNEIDVWMCPTMSDPPAILASDDPMVLLSDDFRFDNWRAIANVTGQPAITLPLHWTESGLPLGVQFQGRFGDEATLFRLSGQLEQAAPWSDRRPPL